MYRPTPKPGFVSQQRPHARLLPWLMARGSLTAKFEALSGQKLQVISTFEGRTTLGFAECKKLQLSPQRPYAAWVRESLLYGEKGQPAWVKARSVFPFISLVGDARQLLNLGTTPIGYVMFGRQGARLTKRWFELTEDGWMRTSLYDWQGRQLLVSETFLPAFLRKINSRQA